MPRKLLERAPTGNFTPWVFYFGKKLVKFCVQIVTTRIHVHSQSFITYQKHRG
jgi:hypothetical protein